MSARSYALTAAELEATKAELQALLTPDGRVSESVMLSGGPTYLDNIERIRCRDGFSVSVQASRFHYCLPRDNRGPWTHVELGFPTRRLPSLAEYRDGSAPDTKNVFGYVPIEKVAEVLVWHGGIAKAEGK